MPLSANINATHARPFRDIREARRRTNPLRKIFHAVQGRLSANSFATSNALALISRAAASGLPADQFEDVLRSNTTPQDVATEFLAIARSHYGKGAYWADMGVTNQARDNYVLAMLWCLYAELFIEEPFLRSRVHPLYDDGYKRAATFFAPTALPVAIEYPGGIINGYLRVPDGEPPINGQFPCAILVNGLSTTKEDFFFTENTLLAANIATLSFDYPGMHEETAQAVMALDADALIHSLCTFLERQLRIDATRIGLYGVSLGARLALYWATMLPNRFKAVVALSAPFDMLADVDTLHATLEQEAAIYPGTSKSSLIEFAWKTPLKNRLDRLVAPLLVAGGGRDLVALPEETSFVYESASSADKKLVLCPSAGHMCSEMMPSLRHETAQWISHRI